MVTSIPVSAASFTFFAYVGIEIYENDQIAGKKAVEIAKSLR
jgi:hypothetical protein